MTILRAPPHLSAPTLAPSPAQSTLEILFHPLEDLLAHSALLVGMPELEELSVEGPGLLLRGPLAWPVTPPASASSHPGTCPSAATSGPAWLLRSGLSQGRTGCPQARAAVGAWPSPGRHIWHLLPPWLQQPSATPWPASS